jgi:hypothetical protein
MTGTVLGQLPIASAWGRNVFAHGTAVRLDDQLLTLLDNTKSIKSLAAFGCGASVSIAILLR